MALRPIYSHWHIELDDEFGRRMTDDGFVVFEVSGRSVWAAVYDMGDSPPEAVIREYLSSRNEKARLQYRFGSDSRLCGHWALVDRGETVECLTADTEELCVLRFRFDHEPAIDWAQNIWKTIQHSPPG